MAAPTYSWREGDAQHDLRLVHVPGTRGTPYLFGTEPRRVPIEIRDFFIASTPVTHALWLHVMGSTRAPQSALRYPVEHVSWHDVTGADGFLDRINAGTILRSFAARDSGFKFRLPSETEWEYAARGGPHWTDGFIYSGSNDPDAVAWYGHRWSLARRFGTRLLGARLGWRIFGRFPPGRPTSTRPVATKAPNQLGIYDMSGNVWEWCQDGCISDMDMVPRDGKPWLGVIDERRLRGGCHHNWDIHCTVSFRYGLDPNASDGCIGFRLVLAPP
jgi:formylglycine-generating enzyme required for sulfatase activity